MKKLITVLMLVLLAITSNAQIQFEKSYSNSYRVSYYSLIDKGEYAFIISDIESGKVSIYGSDHSLITEINYPTPPSGYKLENGSITILYRKLIDDDEGIEFVANYLKEDSENISIVYDDDGSEIKRFEDMWFYSVSNTDNGAKMLFYKTTLNPFITTTYVFSVKGIVPMTVKDDVVNSGAFELGAYPNPANNIINLTYNLPDGEITATMRIFNNIGQLVQTVQVGSHFKSVLIDVSTYSKGTYFYSMNGVTKQFVVD